MVSGEFSLTVSSVSRCGTSSSMEQGKIRTKRVVELRFTCKPALSKSALGRTRTCGLLNRRPNRTVLWGAFGAFVEHFRILKDLLVLPCSRHAPVNSTGLSTTTLGQGTRAWELARNHPQLRCAAQRHVPPGIPSLVRPALLSDPEVLTLAILAQWPRFRSERDFWRFAQAHLRPYCSPRR